MIHLLAIAFPPEIFDAAAKVTSGWALGAFGIAAVVAIVAILVGNKSRSAADRFPKGAVIVIVIAITIPVAGEVIVAAFPKTPYKVTITVEDLKGFVVTDAHVRCGCGIQPAKTEGVSVFEIHPDDVPENHQLTFFADDGKNSGKKSISFGRTRSISETISLTEQTQAKSPELRNVPPTKVTPPKTVKSQTKVVDPELRKLRTLHKVSLIGPVESGFPLKVMRNNTYGFLTGNSLDLIHTEAIPPFEYTVSNSPKYDTFEIHKLSDGHLELVGYISKEALARFRSGLKAGDMIFISSWRWYDGSELISIPLIAFNYAEDRGISNGDLARPGMLAYVISATAVETPTADK